MVIHRSLIYLTRAHEFSQILHGWFPPLFRPPLLLNCLLSYTTRLVVCARYSDDDDYFFSANIWQQLTTLVYHAMADIKVIRKEPLLLLGISPRNLQRLDIITDQADHERVGLKHIEFNYRFLFSLPFQKMVEVLEEVKEFRFCSFTIQDLFNTILQEGRIEDFKVLFLSFSQFEYPSSVTFLLRYLCLFEMFLVVPPPLPKPWVPAIASNIR